MTKRDFFEKFYSAFDRVFTKANVRSGWLKAGMKPFDPDQLLKIFREKGGDQSEALGASTPSRHLSSCLDTPPAQRTIGNIVNKAVTERDARTEKAIRKLGGACITLSSKLKLAEDRERGYLEVLDNEKKKGQTWTGLH